MVEQIQQPCGPECAFAQSAPGEAWDEDWAWCTHPCSAVRLARFGRECPRYTPPTPGILAARAKQPQPLIRSTP